MGPERSTKSASDGWPRLPVGMGQDTYATLHRWMQIIGKIRLAQYPMVNHWWGVTLYVTTRGLTTLPMPYGTRSFQIDFDFIDHLLRITTNDGSTRSIALVPRSVADFYGEVMAALASLDLRVRIWPMPVEIPDPVRFDLDTEHCSYKAEDAQRLWQALVQANRVMAAFRAGFLGKVSPVHFFWGSFDLAVTRFSGRAAPPHPSTPWVADSITREAYSHEVSSCGFWPGTADQEAVFYSYAYPEPAGYRDAPVHPQAASFSREMGEFLLPYHAVQDAANPDDMLLQFLQSTYEAAAACGHWDRGNLERTSPSGPSCL